MGQVFGGNWGDPFGSYTCMVDWFTVPCSTALQVLVSGGGSFGPVSPSPIPVRYNGKNTFAFFRNFGDGYAGYMPMNARYIGGGNIRPYGSGRPVLGQSPGSSQNSNLQALNSSFGSFPDGENELALLPTSDFRNQILSYLDEFLKKYPNCENVLYGVANEILGIIDARDQDNPIEILVSALSFIDKTDKDDVASGRYVSDGIIEFYRSFSSEESLGKGHIIFHEILHHIFEGHRRIVEELKIDLFIPYPEIPVKPQSSFITKEQWEATHRRKDGSDTIADHSIRIWMDRDCKNIGEVIK